MIPIRCMRSTCDARIAAITAEEVLMQAELAGWMYDGTSWLCAGCQRARVIGAGLDEIVRRCFPDTQSPPTLEIGDAIPTPTQTERL